MSTEFLNNKNLSAEFSNNNENSPEINNKNNQVSLKQIVEALLFAENNPLTLIRLVEITQASAEQIISVLKELNQEYEATKRAFRIEQVANGYQLYTLPEFGQWIRNLYKTPYHRLSRAALETLAIIIYNQPITRPEIEKIRGVDCSGPLLTLLERKLIRIEGRAKKPGGPFLYGTGKEFLRYFGLSSLNDLPSKEELEAFLQKQGE
ncbi:MAG: SMC-Scp complex subunit ScpB [candidate division WOR-3 bacterium]